MALITDKAQAKAVAAAAGVPVPEGELLRSATQVPMALCMHRPCTATQHHAHTCTWICAYRCTYRCTCTAHAHARALHMQVPTVPYPFVLKPCCEDNSMGISKV